MIGTDNEVVARYIAGDRDAALGEIMRRYASRLQPTLLQMFHTFEPDIRHELVQDILQETWIRAANHMASFDPSCKFSTWLFTIATNLARNELRNHRRRSQVVMRFPMQHGDDATAFDAPDTRHGSQPDIVVETDDLLERVARYLNDNAPDDYLVVLQLRELDGASYALIAQRAGIPVGTVKSRLNRIRAKARYFVEQYG